VRSNHKRANGNTKPVANLDFATIGEDAAVATVSGRLLGNDRDADGDVLRVISVSGAEGGGQGLNGVLTWKARGAFTYTLDNADAEVNALNVGQTLTDVFTYTVSDGRDGVVTSTLTVTIKGANDAPEVAAPIADQTVEADTRWTFRIPDGAVFDPDDQTLAYSATRADGQALPSWLSFDKATHSFVGTPPADAGTLSLRVTASDGRLSTSQTFDVVVADHSTRQPPAGEPQDPGGAIGRPFIGVYAGHDPADYHAFENWLGRPMEGFLAYTGDADWYDMSPNWTQSQLSGHGLFWSIPLFPQSSSLSAVAAGAGDGWFRQYAQQILDNTPPALDGNIYVRTGWEIGGGWMPWDVEGYDNPELFKAAFKSFAEAFHSVSDVFKIVWDVAGDVQRDPTIFYPGDKYVDVVSMDFYWTEWMSSDGRVAFESIRDMPYGLQWLEDFGDARGKPLAHSEWGVPGDRDASDFIRAAAEWFNDPDNDVIYHTYWQSDFAYNGLLSPASAQTFKELFE
jgi:VCBS repeat-containing protein